MAGIYCNNKTEKDKDTEDWNKVTCSPCKRKEAEKTIRAIDFGVGME